MSASGEMIRTRPRPAVQEAIETACGAVECDGTRKLRVLLHAGVSAVWPAIKAKPQRQIHTLEVAVAALRRRWEDRLDPADTPGPELFRELDAEVGAYLKLCAERSDTEWLEPVEAISAYVVAVMHGAVMRWLAEGDDEIILVVCDDLVSTLTTKAVCR
ncbi:TetR family transcriptional regulator [Nocardia vermiculata]|nr:TetR family transcriptional regulator [Nocardia vermiculata]